MAEPLTTDQIFIRKLTEIIVANLGNENFGVNELGDAAELSIYRLGRRLHSINRKTIIQFIREVRLQKALEMLQNEEYTASEVAYRTGFGSPAYFNKCFHEYFGYSPGKVKKGDPNNPELNILTQVTDEKIQKKPAWRAFVLSLPGILLLAMLSVTVGYLIFNKIHKSKKSDDLISSDGRISIAVMPFHNMTNDTILNVWQDGIQTNLITSLSNSGELKVRQIETISNYLKSKGLSNYASITPSVGSSIAQKLDANVLIHGSINQAGATIRINAQLINSNTEEPFKSF